MEPIDRHEHVGGVRLGGDVNEADVKALLVAHYSYAKKLTPETAAELAKLRDTYAYLRGPTVSKVYRGLRNVPGEVLAELRDHETTDPLRDISWTLDPEVAWRFARCEWSSDEPVAGCFAVVVAARPKRAQLLLSAPTAAATDGIGNWYHDRWRETLASAIRVEREVVAVESLSLLSVHAEPNPADRIVFKRTAKIAKTLHPHFNMQTTKKITKAEPSQWEAAGDRNLEVVERNWSGDDARARVLEWASNADGEVVLSKARRAFLIVDAANDQLVASYKEGFADIVDGELVAISSGLSAARARLGQVKGVPDDVIEAAQATLDAYKAKQEEQAMDKRATTHKSILDGQLIRGMHVHAYDEDEHCTPVDGDHRHTFVLPDGRKVTTELGGRHAHRGYEDSYYLWGGDHVHSVVIDGAELWTPIGGWHEHQLMGNSTSIDGQHCHYLVLADGSTIESHDETYEPAEVAPAPPAETLLSKALANFPSPAGRSRVTWSVCKSSAGSRVELRMEYPRDTDDGVKPGGAVGLVFQASDFAELGRASSVALMHPDDAALDVQAGEGLPGTEHLRVSKGWVEPGMRDADGLELFVEGAVAGAVKITTTTKGMRARLRQNAAPDSYTRGEVGPVPSSLALQLPAELDWWSPRVPTEVAKARLAKARELGVLDVVDTQSGVFTRCRVVQRVEPVTADTMTVEALVKSLAGERQCVRITKASDAARVGDDVGLVDTTQPGLDLRRAVGFAKARGPSKSNIVLAHDTPEARAALGSLGHLYVVTLDKAVGMVLGSSKPLHHELLRSAAPTESLSKGARLSPIAKRDPWIRLVKGSQQVVVTKDAVEKRLVYGVVLEPDMVDAHGDTIDADTIEKAAHGYLVDNANVGYQHDFLINEYARVVESYIAPQDLTIGSEVVTKGTWVIVTKILDESLWADIKAGVTTGYSIGGLGSREAV